MSPPCSVYRLPETWAADPDGLAAYFLERIMAEIYIIAAIGIAFAMAISEDE